MKSTEAFKDVVKKITVGSDYSGVGAFDYAMKRISADKEFEVENKFSCDFDYYARVAYLANHGTPNDLELAQSPQHKKYADGVKKIVLSPDEPTKEQEAFLKEANEFCKHFSFYYPFNVYDREIPTESVDIYMTSPPCQSFSLAGQRKGKDDENGRGILFFNSLEFIKVNQPRFFIFENVRGLLSHDKTNPKAKIGNTFQEWINHLGGKSVNGVPIVFPEDNAVEYHLYWRVLNSREHGVPQNRERVFLIGIRDDKDNKFQYPKEEFLEKRLKDVLELEVDEKYFLSEQMLQGFLTKQTKGFGERFNPTSGEKYAMAITTTGGSRITDNYLKVGFINQDTQASQVFSENGTAPTISAGTHGYALGYVKTNGKSVKIKSATKKGYEEATENDSINFSIPTSETRRGRVGVGVGVAQTLDTQCNQGVCIPVLTPDRPEKRQNGRRFKEDGDPSFTLTAQDRHGIYDGFRIRRLTPLECFRLQDFPDVHVKNAKAAKVSDSQLYKQAGNSITVRSLQKIINNLPL